MATWPCELSLESFREAWVLTGEPFWRNVFEMHKDKMQIKSPNVAIINLEKIFTATFRLANTKGFQVMSLRDLSRETGISMGGLYSYIGSKNDLASVIEGVLRNYIDQVIGGLANENLSPVDFLRAIVYGEIYMMQILSPWYYFCYMELKGLPKEQQQQAMDLELRFESYLINAFQAGVRSGQFVCEKPELLASHVTAQLQQWHLMHWKLKQRNIQMQEYAENVLENLLLCLGVKTGAAAASTQQQKRA